MDIQSQMNPENDDYKATMDALTKLVDRAIEMERLDMLMSMDMNLIEISKDLGDNLDKLSKKKRIILKVDNNADLSQD